MYKHCIFQRINFLHMHMECSNATVPEGVDLGKCPLLRESPLSELLLVLLVLHCTMFLLLPTFHTAPTLKLKRSVITFKYLDSIDSFYS